MILQAEAEERCADQVGGAAVDAAVAWDHSLGKETASRPPKSVARPTQVVVFLANLVLPPLLALSRLLLLPSPLPGLCIDLPSAAYQDIYCGDLCGVVVVIL